MFCSKCGKELSDDSKFCPSCGKQVERIIKTNAENELFRVIGHFMTDSNKFLFMIIVGVMLFITFGPFYQIIANDGYNTEMQNRISAISSIKDIFNKEMLMSDWKWFYFLSLLCVVVFSIGGAFWGIMFWKQLITYKKIKIEYIKSAILCSCIFSISTFALTLAYQKSSDQFYYDSYANYCTKTIVWMLLVIPIFAYFVVIPAYYKNVMPEKEGFYNNISKICAQCKCNYVIGDKCPNCGSNEVLTPIFNSQTIGENIKRDSYFNSQLEEKPRKSLLKSFMVKYKIQFGILLLLIGIGIVYQFGVNNLDKKIVGSWKSDEYYNDMHDWTFYKDGSFEFNEVRGTYIVEGKKLTVHVMSAWYGTGFEEYEVKIKGDRMFMINLEDGEVTRLTRIDQGEWE